MKWSDITVGKDVLRDGEVSFIELLARCGIADRDSGYECSECGSICGIDYGEMELELCCCEFH